MILKTKYAALERALFRQVSAARIAILTLVLLSAGSAWASTYTVNHSWINDGSSPYGASGSRATLTGTIEIHTGKYVLDKSMTNSPLPFSAVNLILTVREGMHTISYALSDPYTYITGNAKVIIHATGRQLVVEQTSDAGSADVAFVQFWDEANLACFAIGHDRLGSAQGAMGEAVFAIQHIPALQVLGTAKDREEREER